MARGDLLEVRIDRYDVCLFPKQVSLRGEKEIKDGGRTRSRLISPIQSATFRPMPFSERRWLLQVSSSPEIRCLAPPLRREWRNASTPCISTVSPSSTVNVGRPMADRSSRAPCALISEFNEELINPARYPNPRPLNVVSNSSSGSFPSSAEVGRRSKGRGKRWYEIYGVGSSSVEDVRAYPGAGRVISGSEKCVLSRWRSDVILGTLFAELVMNLPKTKRS